MTTDHAKRKRGRPRKSPPADITRERRPVGRPRNASLNPDTGTPADQEPTGELNAYESIMLPRLLLAILYAPPSNAERRITQLRRSAGFSILKRNHLNYLIDRALLRKYISIVGGTTHWNEYSELTINNSNTEARNLLTTALQYAINAGLTTEQELNQRLGA